MDAYLNSSAYMEHEGSKALWDIHEQVFQVLFEACFNDDDLSPQSNVMKVWTGMACVAPDTLLNGTTDIDTHEDKNENDEEKPVLCAAEPNIVELGECLCIYCLCKQMQMIHACVFVAQS
jgi:hypothetical protein